MPWFPDAIRLPGQYGGSYIGAPWRVVLHTTEGPSIEGANAAYNANRSWPHFTLDPHRNRLAQHLDFTAGAARALRNEGGGVETNRSNTVQIEVIGYAAETPRWSSLALYRIGDLIARIAASVPIDLSTVVDFRGDNAYGTGAAQRFSHGRWAGFNGVCGHQHVPENSHWDPGDINIETILAAARGQEDELVGAADDIIANQWRAALAAAREADAQRERDWVTHRGIVRLLRDQGYSDKQIKEITGKKALPPDTMPKAEAVPAVVKQAKAAGVDLTAEV